MLNKKDLMYRLSLIKYLFNNSLKEIVKPVPLSVIGLLFMHDAIELFLHLICEHLDINNNKQNFMNYWDVINNSSHNITITKKESMNRLNKSRVAFKHHGTMPSEFDLFSFASISEDFFAENCIASFGIDFANISMIELVKDVEIYDLLNIANQRVDIGELKEGLGYCRLAFELMIKKYEENKLTSYFNNVFDIVDISPFSDSFHMHLNLTNRDTQRDLENFIDQTNRAIKNWGETVKIIGFGIDFRKYSWFKSITPYIQRYADGHYEINYSCSHPLYF